MRSQTINPLLENPLLENMEIYSNLISPEIWHSVLDSLTIAQNVTDPDLLGQMQKAFSNFVQSGQVWALLIGLVVGYLIRNITSYG